MEGPVPAALLESGPVQQKKRPHPIPGTKALRFCDTTQIGACAPTRFTYHHTCPVDNGWEPVGIYWVLGPFKPPSEVHSPPASDPAHTLRGSLCIRLWPLLLSVIGFKYCFVVMHYTYAASICQPQISRRSPQGRPKGRSLRTYPNPAGSVQPASPRGLLQPSLGSGTGFFRRKENLVSEQMTATKIRTKPTTSWRVTGSP